MNWALAFKSLRELGLKPIGLYGLYRLGIQTGYLRWRCDAGQKEALEYPDDLRLHPFIELPERNKLRGILGFRGIQQIVDEADQILNGQVCLFGGEVVQLNLKSSESGSHWTTFEEGQSQDGIDIKLIWEPARFGWAYTLGRAYHLTGDERYAECFWDNFVAFGDNHPPNTYPHWVSAQEVALRLMALAWCGVVFSRSSIFSNASQRARLVRSLVQHAARIPSTLSYARAQNNNHLLSEAVGLLTAGMALPRHPQAQEWCRLGWHYFDQGVHLQIAPDGTYIQHSTNYQRLLLQLGLWVKMLAAQDTHGLSSVTEQRLAIATRWLLALVDAEIGLVPNLGSNDGAYILPLAICPYEDYRPVLQTAAAAFLGKLLYEAGPWDEMRCWLDFDSVEPVTEKPHPGSMVYDQVSSGKKADLLKKKTEQSPHILRTADGSSWAYLRVAKFNSRPGHADQLHLDLWWRGLNLAMDPGTYLYNASPPWDNALVHTSVHNTLMVNGLDQMALVGRFLFLDWAQAWVLAGQRSEGSYWQRLVGEHNGYRHIGADHQRSVESSANTWIITDTVLVGDPRRAERNSPFTINCHWLLPDWPWEMQGTMLQVRSPLGWVRLCIDSGEDLPTPESACLVRAGELIYGVGHVTKVMGWYSPTYHQKQAALSFNVVLRGALPLTLISHWILPESEDQV